MGAAWWLCGTTGAPGDTLSDFQTVMEAFAKKKGKVGTRGSAQIMRENDATLVFYRNMILGANGLFFVTMTVLGRSFFPFDIAMFIVSAISYIGCFQFMRFMAKPSLTPDGSVLSAGTDLNMEGGLADNVKDMIILTAGAQAFSLITSWLWLLLLLAPLRAVFKLWTGVIAPWIFQPGEEPDEVNDKKRRKQDRQMKRAMR